MAGSRSRFAARGLYAMSAYEHGWTNMVENSRFARWEFPMTYISMLLLGVLLLTGVATLAGLYSNASVARVPKDLRPVVFGMSMVCGIIGAGLALWIGRNMAASLFVFAVYDDLIVYTAKGLAICVLVGITISYAAARLAAYATFDRHSDAGRKWPWQ